MSGAGGGSNILRGGKRTYDCKTLVGNFVEEAYRPTAIKSTWSGGPTFETTTKHQMQDGLGIRSPEFGGGLKKQEDLRFDYHQIVGADKTAASANWQSLAHSAHANNRKPTEFAAPQGMRGHPPVGEELEKYRQRWTKENEAVRTMRYVTETTATTDKVVKPHFRKELTKPMQVSYK
ncbi:hypothetical protein Poli38472_007440 [Pythium oligandrum]|uniref:Uncharacterized protein n=1 Tax=Pythium oligandrum TaxID=41045 RepID=A0A8K1FRP0_PYTOL|nr:hypothetical protein Poli38472_007440 [Pythium oligandrum]|eukprot:TMW67768.1 hypothetical protein Poli38472_007440 [Pythium oligandrum]